MVASCELHLHVDSAEKAAVGKFGTDVSDNSVLVQEWSEDDKPEPHSWDFERTGYRRSKCVLSDIERLASHSLLIIGNSQRALVTAERKDPDRIACCVEQDDRVRPRRICKMRRGIGVAHWFDDEPAAEAEAQTGEAADADPAQ